MKTLLPLVVLAVAIVALTPAIIFWGWWAFGGVWLTFGLLNATLLRAFRWDPLTGALVVGSGPLGLADTLYRK